MNDAQIYVVDDDEAVRDSLEALLGSHGHSVALFDSGAAFLSFYTAERRGCVVVDVQMPGMSGLELQRELAVAGSDLPVIVMTGHGDIPMAVKALKAGALDFIEKPFSEEDILDSVARALELSHQEQRQKSLAAKAAVLLERLTNREREVMEQLVIGRPNKVIAYELDISPRTVELHRARVLEKMQVKSLSHLVRVALALGIDPDPK